MHDKSQEQKPENVNIHFLMDRGKIFVSVESIIFIKKYLPESDVVNTVKLHTEQFQNYIQGLPTDDNFKLKILRKENLPPELEGSTSQQTKP